MGRGKAIRAQKTYHGARCVVMMFVGKMDDMDVAVRCVMRMLRCALCGERRVYAVEGSVDVMTMFRRKRLVYTSVPGGFCDLGSRMSRVSTLFTRPSWKRPSGSELASSG
jgi:hypothetical protein